MVVVAHAELSEARTSAAVHTHTVPLPRTTALAILCMTTASIQSTLVGISREEQTDRAEPHHIAGVCAREPPTHSLTHSPAIKASPADLLDPVTTHAATSSGD